MGRGKKIVIFACTGLLILFTGYFLGRASLGGSVLVFAQNADGIYEKSTGSVSDTFDALLDDRDALPVSIAGHAGSSTAETGTPDPDGGTGELQAPDGGSAGDEPGQPGDQPAALQNEPNGRAGTEDVSEQNLPPALVNINTATAEELMALPRIGEVISARIIEYRETNGPFMEKEELMAVSGIGNATFNGLEALITVD